MMPKGPKGQKPPLKRKPKRDDPEQSARFIATGNALGADKDREALERGMKKVMGSPKGARPKSR